MSQKSFVLIKSAAAARQQRSAHEPERDQTSIKTSFDNLDQELEQDTSVEVILDMLLEVDCFRKTGLSVEQTWKARQRSHETVAGDAEDLR